MQKNILIVDDTEDLRDLLRDVLECEGYTVVMANNGLEALQRIEAGQKFDLILLDMTMPEMDGYTCVTEMKRRGRIYALPVIAMSADEQAPEKLCNMNIVGFLSKPFDLDRLLSAVESQLSSMGIR